MTKVRKRQGEISGQVIMEFLLLLVVFLIIGFLFLGVINGQIGERWVRYIGIITSSNVENPQYPELN